MSAFYGGLILGNLASVAEVTERYDFGEGDLIVSCLDYVTRPAHLVCEWVQVPIQDTPDDLKKLPELFNELVLPKVIIAVEQRKRILVHCEQGRHR